MAEVDNYPVGFSMANLTTGNILAMFIRPTFEGIGLGRALMAKTETFFFNIIKKHGLKLINTAVHMVFIKNSVETLSKNYQIEIFDLRN